MASRALARAAWGLPPPSPPASKALGVNDDGKSGQAERALDLFDAMPSKNQVAWNAALVDAGRTEQALSFFSEMSKKNAASYTTMIGGLSHARAVTTAHRLFDQLPLDGHNVFTWTAMLSRHVRNGLSWDAVQPYKDISSWNIMMSGYSWHKLASRDLDLSTSMRNKDSFSWNIVLSCLLENRRGEDALRLFILMNGLTMTEKYGVERTLDHCINVIDLLGRAGRLEEAHALLQNTPFPPNVLAWSTLLHSCLAHEDSSVGSSQHGN
ncbi:hypothetical protein VPH35_058303 [Triticum aestivum]